MGHKDANYPEQSFSTFECSSLCHKRYIHKIQSVKVFVLKSQFLNRYTSKDSELMNMYGNVFFHAKIQWKMSNFV